MATNKLYHTLQAGNMTAKSWKEINSILIKLNKGEYNDNLITILGSYNVLDIVVAYNGLVRKGII